MGDNALLNAILRVGYTDANVNHLEHPAPPPIEIDHFFEVQHVVQIILPLLGPNWYRGRIGEFMDLASFVNDRRNLFRITRDDNQRKRSILLRRYRRSIFIRRYLDSGLEGGGTVRDSVRALARAMRGRQSAYSRLTNAVGTSLCRQMGW
ncbi:hypothetical protein B0T18DRAFT_233317 [Schizothecium vesticola]|uniref:Uncharacterized protein n=1 Tax=Schizothecium vesticola TaxID=314040 RepID=A0AA40ELJ1_9PEZI|nr:hypothetical protein B0T18DRAFT_233317 [Schizothecium vesticola]